MQGPSSMQAKGQKGIQRARDAFQDKIVTGAGGQQGKGYSI